MPRSFRLSRAGVVYHVLNRGNDRRRLFRSDGDYQAFLAVLQEAQQRIPMRVLAYCLMPNHWHLVLWPEHDGAISAYLERATNCHVRRWRRFRRVEGQGHVYQGRFRSFPVECDRSLLAVLRYVEANPLRARLVTRAEDWRWSSLAPGPADDQRPQLTSSPVERPRDWVGFVNAVGSPDEVGHLRQCVIRGRPFGSPDWVGAEAARHGISSSLASKGRPPNAGRGRRWG